MEFFSVFFIILIESLFPINAHVSSYGHFRMIHDTPHDESSYTQGLVIHQGVLYESSGLYGRSNLRIIEHTTGKVLQSKPVAKKYFAEGITIIDNVIYMLTWKERTMLLYNATNLEHIASKSYETFNGEGWGITDDGTCLIVSDGSDIITFFEIPKIKDKGPLKKIKQIQVRDSSSGQYMRLLNELEYVNGYIFANLWYKDIILKIDPKTGQVVKKYDFKDLYPTRTRSADSDSFNGIAFNTTDNSFILTGKQWPKYYVVKLDDEIGDIDEVDVEVDIADA
eukprot:gene10000-20808_t